MHCVLLEQPLMTKLRMAGREVVEALAGREQLEVEEEEARVKMRARREEGEGAGEELPGSRMKRVAEEELQRAFASQEVVGEREGEGRQALP